MAPVPFATPRPSPEEIELDLLLEGIQRRYGLDFRDYARPSLARRVRQYLEAEGFANISELQAQVLRDPQALAALVTAISVRSTAMFRDPAFYRAFRAKVVPALRPLPFFRVWHAGCATGEEVYSVAILLREEGLLDRARIYATDMNEAALRRARTGVFPLRRIREYSLNYERAAGTRSFADYYTVRQDEALFDMALQRNVVWAAHNLATDASFNEFHVVMCRNVMIYFNLALRQRVHALLHDSLAPCGYLALGSQESLDLTGYERRYAAVDEDARIYRKLDSPC